MNMPAQPDMIKRRTIYVDDSVQKWLLVALVTLEIMLITSALWLLYLQLISTVEANLYRAHAVGKPDIYPLLKAALIGLGGLLAINIIVLWIADRLWARHLASILQPFMALVNKVETLDFSAGSLPAKPHEVVNLARSWRDTERQRLLNLRAAINQLEAPGETSSDEQKERLRAALETIRQFLP